MIAKPLIVLPRASRYDRANSDVLVGPARALVATAFPDGFDVCYASEYKPGLPDRPVVFTGQESLNLLKPGRLLDHERGYVWRLHNGARAIATYWPQDAVDHQNVEGFDDESDDDLAADNGKDAATTRRMNYRFWFLQDCAKLLNPPPDHKYAAYLPLDFGTAKRVLSSVRNSTIYFDIECNPDDNYLLCFSFAINDGPVFTVPVYNHTGNLVSREPLVGLVRAFSRTAGNTVVIHNAFFDLPFLALYHHIPAPHKVHDTMLMGHRLWPEADKSIAHAISLYINAPFHKDQGGTWNPKTAAQFEALMRYNGRDVDTLRAVYKAMNRMADTDSGLRASVDQVNASIYPYLYTSLHGLPINGIALLRHKQAQEPRMEFYRKIVCKLAGYDLNPGSSQQLADYLINRMKLPVLSVTESGAPQVDEKTIYRYIVQTKNPLLAAVLRYKRASKVHGFLGFKMWLGNQGRTN